MRGLHQATPPCAKGGQLLLLDKGEALNSLPRSGVCLQGEGEVPCRTSSPSITPDPPAHASSVQGLVGELPRAGPGALVT